MQRKKLFITPKFKKLTPVTMSVINVIAGTWIKSNEMKPHKYP